MNASLPGFHADKALAQKKGYSVGFHRFIDRVGGTKIVPSAPKGGFTHIEGSVPPILPLRDFPIEVMCFRYDFPPHCSPDRDPCCIPIGLFGQRTL